ncbi:winged helix-turn-helix domain-containing protein [Pleionea sediminis]|uniref:winged helix-turn-helix domain-containing protein n=1 Tax=Pleionea sediminis TaxID=2569479 RepID=UPI001186533B|nr:winged helix-turn-helix domain-containing protein [Pleionea sediminis]
MEEQKIITLGSSEVRFDREAMLLSSKNGEIKLDKKVSLLLEFFLERQDRVVTRAELIENVWANSFVSNDAINRAVSVLRKALGGAKDDYIVTIPKVGYRFTIPTHKSFSSELHIKKDLENITLNSIDKENTTSTVEVGSSLTKVDQKKSRLKALSLQGRISAIFFFIFVGLTSFFIWNNHIQNTNVSSDKAIHIAVMPFRDLSQKSPQDLFTAGLTEEVINNLARVEGAVVIRPGMSYQNEEYQLNFKSLAEDTSANYVLTGSVRRYSSKFKVAIQLLNVNTQELVFSNIFNRELSDYFYVQEELSQQISSALSLSLVHGVNLYSKNVEHLSFKAIEELTIARARINKFTEQDIKSAIDSLEDLNRRFPDTAEILGLLAFGKFQLNSSTNIDVDSYLKENIAMAERAIRLEPSNTDALFTLANIYIGFPDWRDQGYQTLKVLLEENPGNKSLYIGMLFNFGILNPDCKSLVNFVGMIPENIFSKRKLDALHYVVAPCLENSTWKYKYDRGELNSEILWFTYKLYLAGDDLLSAVKKMAEDNPNPRYLAEFYDYLLYIGADQLAENTYKKINSNGKGIWRFTMDMIGYLNNVEGTRKPADYLSFVKKNFRNASLPGFSVALVKQAVELGDNSIVQEYVENVPEFPVTLQNRGESVGLAYLYYSLGNKNESFRIASELSSLLNKQWNKDKKSYHYWNFAPLSFFTALLKEDFASAEMILKERFSEDYEYWFLDYRSTSFALHYWRDEPVVKRYLEKIKFDQSRIREEFYKSL